MPTIRPAGTRQPSVQTGCFVEVAAPRAGGSRAFGRRVTLAAALLLGIAAPAAAQIQVYCGGRVVIERFTVLGTPGAQGRTNYSAHLRNTRGVPQPLVVVMAGDALGRPMGRRLTLPGNGRMVLPLGYHPRRPGMPPLTAERLAEATRISCP